MRNSSSVLPGDQVCLQPSQNRRPPRDEHEQTTTRGTAGLATPRPVSVLETTESGCAVAGYAGLVAGAAAGIDVTRGLEAMMIHARNPDEGSCYHTASGSKTAAGV
jgi:hypothetical protein